jgi:hypothetical protein
MEWPAWWSWELDLSSHVKKRMIARDFTELDLRTMMHDATGFRVDVVDGRWVIEARRRGKPWEVIVEPDMTGRRLVVITAYALS